MTHNRGRVGVVIIEDDPDFQRRLRELLSQDPQTLRELLSQDPRFEIFHVARSGEEAAEAMAEACPDLVLVDFRLPGLNGLETARKVKAQCPGVKIVLISAMISDNTEAAFHRFAKDAGIHEVISKSSLTLEKIQRLVDEDWGDVRRAA